MCIVSTFKLVAMKLNMYSMLSFKKTKIQVKNYKNFKRLLNLRQFNLNKKLSTLYFGALSFDLQGAKVQGQPCQKWFGIENLSKVCKINIEESAMFKIAKIK